MIYKRPETKDISEFEILSCIKNQTPKGMTEFKETCYNVMNKKVCIQMRFVLAKQDYKYNITIE